MTLLQAGERRAHGSERGGIVAPPLARVYSYH